MNYHNITHEDMLNGDGLRVVLWVAGCNHYCKNCQNPITWDINGGIPFDKNAIKAIVEELSKDYCSGITFSGGDPLHPYNRKEILNIIENVIKPYFVYQNEAEAEYWIPGAFSNETASRVLEGTKKVVNNPNGTGYEIGRASCRERV